MGNITAIGGSNPATYTYDSLGQMLTETIDGITTTYTYDEAGNILTVNDGYMTHTYTYGDADWKDLLTAYDGYAITYDAIGNPLSWYNGTSFTWELGRRLMSATNAYTGLSNSYTYNADGLRLTKTVGTVEHKYVWQGNQLISEYYGGKELHFFYDESGAPFAFAYKSSATATPVFYYYVTNLQGDVIKILNASGSTVATYSYDAWGKILDSSGSMADINPIRYRGYYYDTDTELYYVSTRYYDPQIARFINADDVSMLGLNGDYSSHNLFAYCGNNPVSRNDENGYFWNYVVGAVVGAVIGIVTTAVDIVKNSENGVKELVTKKSLGKIAISAACGVVNGVVAASGASLIAAATIGATTGFAESLGHELVSNEGEMTEKSWGNVAKDTVSGLAGGFAGGSGAVRGNKYIARQTERFLKHVVPDGLTNALTFGWKMTANYSKQFVSKTLWGLTKGWTGGQITGNTIIPYFCN